MYYQSMFFIDVVNRVGILIVLSKPTGVSMIKQETTYD